MAFGKPISKSFAPNINTEYMVIDLKGFLYLVLLD